MKVNQTGATAMTPHTSSSSQSLLKLIQLLLPAEAPASLVSSHFAHALQHLSNSATTTRY
jgi:hypothetical protein